MKKQVMYKELAKYYDLIYLSKDYKKESKKLMRIIKRYKKSEGKNLLDVACGTGSHLKFLEKKFDCFGIDVNNEMLKIARKKLKKVILRKANMVNFSI